MADPFGVDLLVSTWHVDLHPARRCARYSSRFAAGLAGPPVPPGRLAPGRAAELEAAQLGRGLLLLAGGGALGVAASRSACSAMIFARFSAPLLMPQQ
jgi:hypothetical protein